MSENNWQLCPRCSGEGLVYDPMSGGTGPTRVCPVCNGGKLISNITGKPRPTCYSKTTTSNKTGS